MSIKTKPTTTGVKKLTMAQACKLAGVNKDVVVKLVREGALTVLNLSGGPRPNRFFLEDELELFNREILHGWERCCEAMRGYRRTWGRCR